MRKYLKFILLALLAALLLWWFGRSLDWQRVDEAVRQSNPYPLAAAFVLICTTYLIRACRWRALLAPLTPASLRELFLATTVGFGAVFLLGRAGEVVRPIVLPLRDKRVKLGASFITIIVERICDLSFVIMLFAINLLWFQPAANREAEFAHVRTAGFGLLIAAIVGLASLMVFKRHSDSFIGWIAARFERWRLMPKRIGQIVVRMLEQLAEALSVFTNKRELLVTIGWTAVLWLVNSLTVWLVLRAFGLPFGVRETLFVLGWALVGSLVPTPGGSAGAYHAATAASLVSLNVAREQAAAISIIAHLIAFAPATLFSLYYFLRGDINIKGLRHLASSETFEHKAGEPVRVAQ